MSVTVRPSPGKPRRAKDKPFAVVDIGSNSVRLVVYERLCRAPVPLFNEKSLCRLGAEVAASGKLSASAVTSTLKALQRFAHVAQAFEVGGIDVVATEAVRKARNGGDFLVAAEAAAGAPVQVLEGEEEARTAATGVAYSFHRADGVVGDLGGGSIDLGFVTPKGASGPFGSLPLGTLVMGKALGSRAAEAPGIVKEALAGLPWLKGAARGKHFYVVGGGWRALGRVHEAMTDAPLRVVHDYRIPGPEAERLGRSIATLDQASLEALPGAPRRRVETLTAASFLFAQIVGALEPDEVVFSAFGLREGRLFDKLSPAELKRDPLLAATHDFGRSRVRMPGIATAMQGWTAQLFPDETPAERRLRHAVCEISDSAWREHPGSRAREAFFRIANYPWIGASHAERAFLAYAIFIRYEGRPEDPFIKTIMTLVSEADRRRAEILGSSLQLGYRLAAAVPDLLAGNRLDLSDGQLTLRLRSAALAPDDDILNQRLKGVARFAGAERFKVVADA
ncbi:MAG: hypothetical protein U1E45_21205 [Geminicoccaceae bacterium]